MAKSDYGKPATVGGGKPNGMSDEEWTIRWKRAMGELPELTDEQFNDYIIKIRKALK